MDKILQSVYTRSVLPKLTKYFQKMVEEDLMPGLGPGSARQKEELLQDMTAAAPSLKLIRVDSWTVRLLMCTSHHALGGLINPSAVDASKLIPTLLIKFGLGFSLLDLIKQDGPALLELLTASFSAELSMSKGVIHCVQTLPSLPDVFWEALAGFEHARYARNVVIPTAVFMASTMPCVHMHVSCNFAGIYDLATQVLAVSGDLLAPIVCQICELNPSRAADKIQWCWSQFGISGAGMEANTGTNRAEVAAHVAEAVCSHKCYKCSHQPLGSSITFWCVSSDVYRTTGRCGGEGIVRSAASREGFDGPTASEQRDLPQNITNIVQQLPLLVRFAH